MGILDGQLRRILGADVDSFLGPSSLAFCLSLCGDAFGAGQMRGKELPGSVQGSARFVEDGVVGLENVRDAGGDVEGDGAVGDSGLPGEADGVVEEDLVSSDLDDRRLRRRPVWLRSRSHRRAAAAPIPTP